MDFVMSVGEALFLRRYCARFPKGERFDPEREARHGDTSAARRLDIAGTDYIMGIVHEMESHGLIELHEDGTASVTDLGDDVWRNVLRINTKKAVRYRSDADGR